MTMEMESIPMLKDIIELRGSAKYNKVILFNSKDITFEDITDDDFVVKKRSWRQGSLWVSLSKL